MKISIGPYDEQSAKRQLTAYMKQGYCTIPSLVTFLRNDYRELSLEKAVKIVNSWIDENHIKHEHLAIAYNTRLQQKVVVKQSTLDKLYERKASK